MKKSAIILKQLLLCLSCIFLLNCASLPKDVSRQQSFAYSTPESTTIGKMLVPYMQGHPGKSGVLLLDQAKDALLVRNAMAGLAEKTLDVQYYIWENDKAGLLLMHRMIEAADRGVRVRVLLDDFSLKVSDIHLAVINAHPNIQVRLFNPFSNRKSKQFGFITDFSRVNHRMHNKLYIMDNTLAIVGGRNIGDQYFGLSEAYNFRDLDVLATAPGVSDISESFDIFWNSEWAFPIDAIYREAINVNQIDQFADKLKHHVEAGIANIPFLVDMTSEQMLARLRTVLSEFIWAPVHIVHDLPDKVNHSQAGLRDQSRVLFTELQKELYAQIAYFVPGSEGVKNLKRLVDKGIKVKLITNSFSSNDVMAAHAGYASYRRKLLNAGIDLYEYKPDAQERLSWPVTAHDAPTRLHTKSYVIDRRYVFIGSFNIDPRSLWLNTEIGLIIDSPSFAKKVINTFDVARKSLNSYALSIDNNTNQIRWQDSAQGMTTKSEPHISMWNKLKIGLFRLLPIETLL